MKKGFFYGFKSSFDDVFLERGLERFFEKVDNPEEADVVFISVNRDFDICSRSFKRFRDKFKAAIVDSVFERFSLRRKPFWRRFLYNRKIDKVFSGECDIYFITDDGSGGDILAYNKGVNYVLIPPAKWTLNIEDKLTSRRKAKIPLNGVYVGYIGYPEEEFGYKLLEKIYTYGAENFKESSLWWRTLKPLWDALI